MVFEFCWGGAKLDGQKEPPSPQEATWSNTRTCVAGGSRGVGREILLALAAILGAVDKLTQGVHWAHGVILTNVVHLGENRRWKNP